MFLVSPRCRRLGGQRPIRAGRIDSISENLHCFKWVVWPTLPLTKANRLVTEAQLPGSPFRSDLQETETKTGGVNQLVDRVRHFPSKWKSLPDEWSRRLLKFWRRAALMENVAPGRRAEDFQAGMQKRDSLERKQSEVFPAPAAAMGGRSRSTTSRRVYAHHRKSHRDAATG